MYKYQQLIKLSKELIGNIFRFVYLVIYLSVRPGTNLLPHWFPFSFALGVAIGTEGHGRITETCWYSARTGIATFAQAYL